MNSSSKILTRFSVNGLTLVITFSLAAAHASAQNEVPASGGSFVVPQSPAQNSKTAAPQNQQPSTDSMSLLELPKLPNVSSGYEALLKSRQALAAGDIATAKTMVESARHFPIDSKLTNDTPAKVEAMIARHGELAEMARTGDQHQYNYGAALFLLEQAEGMIDYRDFTAAEALVLQAKRFPVQFKPGDRNPDHVTARLTQVRGSAAVAARNVSAAKLEAGKLLSQAQLAFDQSRLSEAEGLLKQVKQMDLDESAFDEGVILPWELELKISQARKQSAMVSQAAFQSNNDRSVVKQANYYPELDTTQNVKASAAKAVDSDDGNFKVNDVRGRQLYDSGISALENQDIQGALEYFKMAWKYKEQLDAKTQQDLKEKLTHLQVETAQATYQQRESIEAVDEELRRKMFSEVLRQRAVADRMLEQRNPRGALNHLRITREHVEKSDLDPAGKQQLIAVVEREISEMERFIQQNISEIETDESNEANLRAVEMRRQHRVDIERNVQQLVNDFNRLIDEKRYGEAEILARQAYELAPELDVVVSMMERATIQRNAAMEEEIRKARADGLVEALREAEADGIATTNFDNPLVMDPKRWRDLERIRDTERGQGQYTSEQERLIWSALKQQQIQVQFNRTPLSEAIDILAERAEVNMIFDMQAMELENVATDQPVTMNIPNPISVESALKIILSNNNLVFMVEDEVVKITNKAASQADPKSKTYYVGDLIVPVPDFNGSPINMQFLGPQNANPPFTQAPIDPGFAGNDQGSGITPVSMLQQMPGDIRPGFGLDPRLDSWGDYGRGVAPTAASNYNIWGSKGVARGGITEADFEELMELILETVDPDSWEENGGTGRMQPFAATLSLVVTQTQENQDRIQNLLSRLRELNDVQIVVELRFITLRDDFFERIGIDFDFRLNDDAPFTAATIPDRVNPSQVVGREPVGEVFLPTADLDVPFNQNSFGSAVPAFGGFDPLTAANFGFAILSDIEVFFILQAVKGDTRSNVVQAPTVTMFNGQSASVFDGSLEPFVTSVTPVVGDFAAAQQPIITILPEGTQLNVRAVVSSDRRFVKLTLVPFFSEITSVDEFTFEGSRSVRQGGTNLNDILNAIAGNDPLGDDESEIIESGTTVQLPTFANTTVTTTVSVPDGGTVLLGGIKRMSEGRLERGVPFLSNIPYLNRLFTNISIGRETSSLMMMVTPRIIIQEEEAQFQTGVSGTVPGGGG